MGLQLCTASIEVRAASCSTPNDPKYTWKIVYTLLYFSDTTYTLAKDKYPRAYNSERGAVRAAQEAATRHGFPKLAIQYSDLTIKIPGHRRTKIA